MTVGERIKIKRKELGITQGNLAQKLGYKSRSSINKIELGQQQVSQHTLF
jgi:transcriptional regulator with XRE-family HTH domain